MILGSKGRWQKDLKPTSKPLSLRVGRRVFALRMSFLADALNSFVNSVLEFVGRNLSEGFT